jgi:hypothetical protein
MSQGVKTSARALVLTLWSQPENSHLRKKKTCYCELRGSSQAMKHLYISNYIYEINTVPEMQNV